MVGAAALRALLLLADRRLERDRAARAAPRPMLRRRPASWCSWRPGSRSTRRGASATPATRSAGLVDRRDTDLRDRLTQLGNNGRLDHWRVALDGLRRRTRWHGTGAGTYRLDVGARPAARSGRRRPLALPGGAGGAGVSGRGPARDRARRAPGRRGARGSARARAPRPRGVRRRGVALPLHAGVDWDWEMPAVFVWFFAAAGRSSRRPTSAGRGRARAARRGLVAGSRACSSR